MQITLGQQYNVGEKPTVIQYIYINRHAGAPEKHKKTNQRQCSTPSHMVVVIYITKTINTKPLHGIPTGSPLVVTLGQQYDVGEKPSTAILDSV